MAASNPALRAAIHANRAFLGRAVRYLADQGVDQFLDLGSGIPTVGTDALTRERAGRARMGSVHEFARAANPEARVVYVDTDATAVEVGERLLAADPRAAMLCADMRDVDGVLAHPVVRVLLDLDRPFALLAVSVLHFLPGDQPATLLAAYRAALPAGSHLVISHGSLDGLVGGVREANEGVLTTYDRDTDHGVQLRPRSVIASFFGEFELVPPGLVQVGAWRPEAGGGSDPGFSFFGGVGRKA
jgi:SAM-dependent methyltransferase